MKREKIVLAAVAAVCAVALICGGVLFFRQRAALRTANAELQSAQAAGETYRADAEKQKQSNAALQQQLEALQSRLTEAEKQITASKDAQHKLEEQNASLKKQVELAALKKKGQVASAVQPAARPTTLPATQTQTTPIAGKICYLTFDDGPSSNNTPRILETLRKYDVKATFFVVGSGKQEYITKIHEAGHAVGLHCGQHVYSKIYKSEQAYLQDLTAVSGVVKARTGVTTNLVRFPGGSSNTVSRTYNKGIMTRLTKLLPEMGYAYFDWNVSSGDATGGTASAKTITANVLNGAKNKTSICVLMHDNAAKTTTADALPAIIEGLKKQGFSFAPLNKDVTFHHRVAN